MTRTRTPAPRTNKFAGTCSLCRNRVEENAGVTFRNADDTKWITQHNADECPPPAAPKAPKVYAVPELGYYVRADGAGIKVVESKYVRAGESAKRRFGLVFTPHDPKRPTWDYVRGAGISVADLTPMTAHDAALLGLAHGHCIECCAPLGGKTLSSLVAARIGYGETCAGNNGWPFPKGAAAQRDFLNTRRD